VLLRALKLMGVGDVESVAGPRRREVDVGIDEAVAEGPGVAARCVGPDLDGGGPATVFVVDGKLAVTAKSLDGGAVVPAPAEGTVGFDRPTEGLETPAQAG
jgi:hypothetical protein